MRSICGNTSAETRGHLPCERSWRPSVDLFKRPSHPYGGMTSLSAGNVFADQPKKPAKLPLLRGRQSFWLPKEPRCFRCSLCDSCLMLTMQSLTWLFSSGIPGCATRKSSFVRASRTWIGTTECFSDRVAAGNGARAGSCLFSFGTFDNRGQEIPGRQT